MKERKEGRRKRKPHRESLERRQAHVGKTQIRTFRSVVTGRFTYFVTNYIMYTKVIGIDAFRERNEGKNVSPQRIQASVQVKVERENRKKKYKTGPTRSLPKLVGNYDSVRYAPRSFSSNRKRQKRHDIML